MQGEHGIAQKLKVSLDIGIMDGDLQDKLEREKTFDSNKKIEEPLPNYFWYLKEAFRDLLLRLLVISAIAQIILGASPATDNQKVDWIRGVSIFIAVAIVVFTTSIINFRKERKFKELSDFTDKLAKFGAFRDGKSQEILADDILVGDILYVKTGEILAVDGILISGNDIKIDESPLTGESDLIDKEKLSVCIDRRNEAIQNGAKLNSHSIPSPLLFSGTQVKQGSGQFLVLSVGLNSAKGKIEETVKQSRSGDNKTPLEKKLHVLAHHISTFGLLAGLTTLIALMIRWGVLFSSNMTIYNQAIADDTHANITNPQLSVASQIINILFISLTILVVGLPEGLPLCVTLSLSFAINKMMKEKNLIRKIQACETMGTANYICTDKTGTLTTNTMNVSLLFDGHKVLDSEKIFRDIAELKGDDDESQKLNFEPKNPSELFTNLNYYERLKVATALNIDMEIDENENITQPSKTDLAFSDMLHYMGERIYSIRKKYYPSNLADLQKIPFSSTRKKMSTLIENNDFPTGYRIFHKGAVEIVLNSCLYFVNPETNEVVQISDEYRYKIKSVIDSFTNKALRTVCIAYKDLTEEEFKNYEQKDSDGKSLIENSNFVMIYIAGIHDKLRNNVPDAVKSCHKAGVTVVMVTGDNRDTAVAIAKEANILSHDQKVTKYAAMEGEQFFNLIGGLMCQSCVKDSGDCTCPKTQKDAIIRGVPMKREMIKNMDVFAEITNELRVLARSRPLDKYTLVLGLKDLDNIVAVTGDGTNDAPALSKANVGFAMFIQGTDIAKNAADILLLDDNFASTITAVLWGRNVFDNIRKFIQFNLTINGSVSFLVFIAACMGDSPISGIQLLWINLIINPLGGLVYASDNPTKDLLDRKPYTSEEAIIGGRIWKHIIITAVILLGLSLFLYLYAYEFVIEDNPSRIAQIDLINTCFGMVPGVAPKDGVYHILSGNYNKWLVSALLKPGLGATECKEYASALNLSAAYKVYTDINGSNVHMAMVFNTFTIFSLFLHLLDRKINDELNIFPGIIKNLTMISLILLETAIQVILIEFGGLTFHVPNQGLTGYQWAVCIGFGFIGVIVNFILRFITFEKFCVFGSIKDKIKVEDMELISALHEQDPERRSIIVRDIHIEKIRSREASIVVKPANIRSKSTFLEENLNSLSRSNSKYEFLNKIRDPKPVLN